MDDPGRLRLPSATEATGAFDAELELDLGNLLACDARGPDPNAIQDDATGACIAHGRDVVQRLINELFSLPTVTDQGLVAGRLVELPPPRTRLPREKPLPVPKAPTRWEAYAKEKGIVKRKRSARVWDEDAGEWRGRHGYGRAGDAADVVVMDAKPWETTGAEDPFTAARAEKRARVAAQEGRQVKNLSAAAKRGGGAALPPGVTLSSMLPLDGRGGGGGAPLGARLGRDGLKQAAAVARLSTASMGKFDRPVEGERTDRPAGKRRKFLPVTGGAAAGGPSGERAAMAAALDKLARRDAGEGKLNVDRAINLVATEKAQAAGLRRAQDGGRGGRGGGRGRGGRGGRGRGKD